MTEIEQIYHNSKCRVSTEEGYSDWFEVITGVRQGYILSLLLFTIAVDWVIKHATEGKGIQRTDGRKLADLDFADNIATLADIPPKLQLLVDEISRFAGHIELIISTEKTNNMLS